MSNNKSSTDVFLKLAKKLRTPARVQRYISQLKYNKKSTLYSALTTYQKRSAHCMEGAMLAAAICEQLGFPPLVMSFESVDSLDHVIFIYRSNGRWGSIGQSRDLGLHGRKPVFKSLKALALSYHEPYIDLTGRITGFGVASLEETKCNWRTSSRSVWKAENFLLELKHIKIPISERKYQALYNAYIEKGPLKRGPHWTI
ncbi:MAG: hypothetical protein ACK5P6_06850 [Pseudobdellovibrionaceae bacterium]